MIRPILDAWRKRNPGEPLWRVLWWSYVCRPLSYLAVRSFWGHRAWGIHNIPREGPVLLLCNHQSYLDLAVLGVALWHRHFHSMARASLFRPGFFGWLIRSLSAFPVEQGKGDVRALRRAIELLRQGHLVLVFPEGSRTPDGTLQPFAEGIMLLIRRAKPTVVPMAVDGTYDVWPIGRSLPRLRGRVGAEYGEPIDAEKLLAMPPDEATRLLRQRIESLRLSVRGRLRRASGGLYPTGGRGDQAVVDRGGGERCVGQHAHV
jgi:1-acyl-sn-glycerol-3-phosphate acyltransferase